MTSLSKKLEASLHRAIQYANVRRHEFSTPEHLLLALVDDLDAVDVMRACLVDLEQLRERLIGYLDNELKPITEKPAQDAHPTNSFQRVVQRAIVHVQTSQREEVTGADVLLGIFSEPESAAANFLKEQEMTRFDAVQFLTHGIGKRRDTSENSSPKDRLHPQPESAPQIFISHADADKRRILPIINVLIAQGYTIWIDQPRALGLQNNAFVRGIRSFESWQESIRSAVTKSACTIVFWSKNSTDSKRTELHEEARIAKAQSSLIQVAIDPLRDITLPLGFSERQVIPLSDELNEFDERRATLDLPDLLSDIKELLKRPDNRTSRRPVKSKPAPSVKPVKNATAPIDVEWGKDRRLHTKPPPFDAPDNPSLLEHTISTLIYSTKGITELLKSKRVQARHDYIVLFESYLAEIKKDGEEFNPILLETIYLEIYGLLRADDDILPAPLRIKSSTWARNHQGLRTHYTIVREYYLRQRDGCLTQPVPQDAVSAFEKIVSEESQFFDAAVAETLKQAPEPPVAHQTQNSDVTSSNGESALPSLPTDELANSVSQTSASYWQASTINEIWSAVLDAPNAVRNRGEWKNLMKQLEPFARLIIEWLRSFLGETGSKS